MFITLIIGFVALSLLTVVFAVTGSTRASTHVWVDFPVTHDENDVAALMLDEDVGKFVARGGGARYPKGFERAKRVLERYEKHPACRMLEDLPRPGKKGKKGKGKGRGGPPGKGKGKA